MSQLSFLGIDPQIYSVAEITRYVRGLLEADYRLQDLWVAGEVSNLSQPASGHLYFTLKDADASLRCVMWRSQAARQRTLPKDGDQVEVHGHISVYEAGGQYQLYADLIRKAGEGELYQRFLRLKADLEEEGLFDPERKRELPRFPRRIGIVTSPTAAALRDALDVLGRRFPLAEVILSPTAVQGEAAPEGIVAALRALEGYGDPDLILLIRGGGSIEDLAAFNEERVARAIAGSRVPVVSGVGHETDFTIADFVADVRAPTPSAAAELAVPDRSELAAEVRDRRAKIVQAYERRLQELRVRFQSLWRTLARASPRAQLANARQQVDDLQRRALSALEHELSLRRSGLRGLRGTLRAVGPPAVLARGYAVVSDESGEVVRSVVQVEPGQTVDVRLSDGRLGASVEEVLPQDEGEQ